MYIEKLTLQVEAKRVGWNVVEPPAVRGDSGVVHSFSFLASKGAMTYAFDIYEAVTEMEILRTYIKKLDGKVFASVICTSGKWTESAEKLAKEYSVRILRNDEVEPFFDSLLLVNHQAV